MDNDNIYQKKPVKVEAIQWTDDDSAIKIMDWAAGQVQAHRSGGRVMVLYVQTPGQTAVADRNDWIIKMLNGNFYICKPDAFEQAYEKASE